MAQSESCLTAVSYDPLYQSFCHCVQHLCFFKENGVYMEGKAYKGLFYNVDKISVILLSPQIIPTQLVYF